MIGSFPGYEPTPRTGALTLTSSSHPQQLLSPTMFESRSRMGEDAYPTPQNSPFLSVSRQGQKCSVRFLGHRRMGRPVYKEDLSSLNSQGTRGMVGSVGVLLGGVGSWCLVSLLSRPEPQPSLNSPWGPGTQNGLNFILHHFTDGGVIYPWSPFI